MKHKYDIRNEGERRIHRAAFELALDGETPERKEALAQALNNTNIPTTRASEIQDAARLGALALRSLS